MCVCEGGGGCLKARFGIEITGLTDQINKTNNFVMGGSGDLVCVREEREMREREKELSLSGRSFAFRYFKKLILGHENL